MKYLLKVRQSIFICEVKFNEQTLLSSYPWLVWEDGDERRSMFLGYSSHPECDKLGKRRQAASGKGSYTSGDAAIKIPLARGLNEV